MQDHDNLTENDCKMTVRIKDVARAAGVSVATVSRALGDGPVSDELRKKVEAAVAATGYLPNLSARRLRSQHSHTIGLIVSDIRNPFLLRSAARWRTPPTRWACASSCAIPTKTRKKKPCICG
jgi:LacI family fructose operon transcriptional repressor